jgi:vacuolar-type H+-ATPase subunit I/STV1
MMNNAALDKLTWVLIYVGLLTLCLGVFVDRMGGGVGWKIGVAGAVAAALGAVLIWVRSRRAA